MFKYAGQPTQGDPLLALTCRLKDAVKQVLHLKSSHDDTSSHHTRLQDQMHKLSDRVGQATHLLGGKGYVVLLFCVYQVFETRKI